MAGNWHGNSGKKCGKIQENVEINSYGTDPLKRGATSLAEDKESEVERLKREKESIVSLLIYLRSRIKTNGT